MSGAARPSRSYLPAPLRVREESHRRRVLLAIAILIVLSATPVFGHHLALRGEALLAGRDHVFGVCLIALHELLQPVHEPSHVLIAVGLSGAVWDRARAWRALRGVVSALDWSAPAIQSRLAGAAAEAGLPLDRIRLVAGLPNPAFTAGWLEPRVYVATALVEMLTHDELSAVLAHEAAHVMRRDPLRLSLLRFLACTLFFLPALRRLAADAADESEIAADDAAATSMSTRAPLALASAIVRIATHWSADRNGATSGPVGTPDGAVGFQRADLTERRVRRLMGEDAVVGTHLTRGSVASAAGALTVIWLSGLMMAHPLAAATTREPGPGMNPARSTTEAARDHCAHHRLALTHLFCLGFHARPAGVRCPHARGL